MYVTVTNDLQFSCSKTNQCYSDFRTFNSMSNNSRRNNKPKRLRNEVNPTEEDSPFTHIIIPLLPGLPQQPSDDLVPSTSSFNLETQSGDECSNDILEMPHSSNESSNANKRELDSMCNEVYDTLIAQTDERETGK